MSEEIVVQSGSTGEPPEPATEPEGNAQARFGTLGGVFTPCVLTILGVIMFMRTGFVTGYGGLWLALVILGISKMITLLTTFSLSAVATNLRMKVGGVYFMISRVLGPDVGGSIGITLYFAQAVSVAFYTIGFTEALFAVLTPLIGAEAEGSVIWAYGPQVVSSAMLIALFFLTFKGADVAIKAQYIVLGVLLLSVASFIVGGAMDFDPAMLKANAGPSFVEGVGFWGAFAIFFPAVTGITAGANMSGDLKDPAKSLPRGTLLAIVFTMAIYVVQIVLMAGSVERQELKDEPFAALQAMSIAGPLVVLGVFAATLSSALGSFLGAPRILQAMGQDRLMGVLTFFGKGSGATNEPRRATVLTFLMALGVVWAGDLNAVAEVISMFFLIAYGMINLSAFVESKSASPTFRPKFRFFHWSLALAGAIGCMVAMVKINETYAMIAFAIVGLIYTYLRKRDLQTSWGDAKRGYIFRQTRENLLYLERNPPHAKAWRPNLVAITEDPLMDRQLIRVGGWLEGRRGLYTVAHVLEDEERSRSGRLRQSRMRRRDLRQQLETDGIVAFTEVVGVDDFLEGLFVFLQSYSIGGLAPNTVLLKLPPATDSERRARFFTVMDILDEFDVNVAVLKPGDVSPSRRRRNIDMWWGGYRNGSLMAMLCYMITLNEGWSRTKIRVRHIVRDEREENQARRDLETLKERARMPAQIELIRRDDPTLEVIAERSVPAADLVLLGLSATSGDGLRTLIEELDPVLERLPTTLLVASNGEADVFV